MSIAINVNAKQTQAERALTGRVRVSHSVNSFSISRVYGSSIRYSSSLRNL